MGYSNISTKVSTVRPVIRKARFEDLNKCVYIAGVFHDGSQFKDVTRYVTQDAYEYAVKCLKSPNKLFMVYEKDQEIVGFFIASKNAVPWNKEQYVSSEDLFFILPEHKSPRIALKLFRAWEKWCREHGVHQMSFTPTSFVDENMDRWDSFCNALDFHRGGIYYKKVLNRAN